MEINITIESILEHLRSQIGQLAQDLALERASNAPLRARITELEAEVSAPE